MDNLKDQMVETKNMLADCMYESIEVGSAESIRKLDSDAFIKEFRSRSKSAQLMVILDLVGVKNFSKLRQYFTKAKQQEKTCPKCGGDLNNVGGCENFDCDYPPF
jgi:hypothetical protein